MTKLILKIIIGYLVAFAIEMILIKEYPNLTKNNWWGYVTPALYSLYCFIEFIEENE